jgi:hypothetical protein
MVQGHVSTTPRHHVNPQKIQAKREKSTDPPVRNGFGLVGARSSSCFSFHDFFSTFTESKRMVLGVPLSRRPSLFNQLRVDKRVDFHGIWDHSLRICT